MRGVLSCFFDSPRCGPGRMEWSLEVTWQPVPWGSRFQHGSQPSESLEFLEFLVDWCLKFLEYLSDGRLSYLGNDGTVFLWQWHVATCRCEGSWRSSGVWRKGKPSPYTAVTIEVQVRHVLVTLFRCSVAVQEEINNNYCIYNYIIL